MGRLGERRIGELENWMVRLDDRLRRIAGRLKRGFLNEVMEMKSDRIAHGNRD